MGSSASKSAMRKFPPAPPAWAGARSPSPSLGEQPHPHARPPPRASESKDEGESCYGTEVALIDSVFSAIRRDAHDPQFLANLSKLGPVRVDHHTQTVQPVRASSLARLCPLIFIGCVQGGGFGATHTPDTVAFRGGSPLTPANTKPACGRVSTGTP